MGRGHIDVGSTHEPYNSNPPTSGPHYEETAQTGFREEEIADEHLVHNLEHGDIWISFRPSVSGEAVDVLKSFSGGEVVVTPRRANETDIALAAWGRLDTFDLEGGVLTESLRQRTRDFIARHINKGPEQVVGGHGGI